MFAGLLAVGLLQNVHLRTAASPSRFLAPDRVLVRR